MDLATKGMEAVRLKFKPPRDSNTQSVVLKLRDVSIEERKSCGVGGGECHNFAVESHDDGAGGEFFVCSYHLEEVYAFGKLIAEMTPNQLRALNQQIIVEEEK